MAKQPLHVQDRVRFVPRGTGYYDTILAFFCVIVVLSNIVAAKPLQIGDELITAGPIQFWPLILDGGAILFPLAYILGDVLSEVYGFKAARRATFTAFAASLLAVATFWIVEKAPGASFYENQAAYEAVLGPVGQIVLASVCGYVVGQLLNARVLVAMKSRSAEKGLVARLMASTVVGQVADTFIFCAIAATAIGIGDLKTFVNYFVVGVLLKVSVEAVFLPVTVRVIRFIKKNEPEYWI